MSDKEKEIFEVFEKVVPRLDNEKAQYLLGFAEGMAAATEKVTVPRHPEHDESLEQKQ